MFLLGNVLKNVYSKVFFYPHEGEIMNDEMVEKGEIKKVVKNSDLKYASH